MCSPLAFVVTSVTDRNEHVAAQVDSSLSNWRASLSRSLATDLSVGSPMVIFPDIMWNSMTFFINFAKCQNFPDANSLTIPRPWKILFLHDISLTAMNPDLAGWASYLLNAPRRLCDGRVCESSKFCGHKWDRENTKYFNILVKHWVISENTIELLVHLKNNYIVL